MSEIAVIEKKDVLWNIMATFLKVASAVLLLPFVLRTFSADLVGIWSIFMTVISIIGLLDFGFNPTFARSISYIYSGVKNLKTIGVTHIEDVQGPVNYNLLSGCIKAMRWFYFRGAILLLFLLLTAGTYYINYILKEYNGDKTEVLIAWFCLCILNTYSFYTLYYEALMLGKGLIKRSKQIVILGRIAYLVFAIILLYCGYGIIALILAQVVSTVIIRTLSYRLFFTKELKSKLAKASAVFHGEIIKSIYPNAIKIGLVCVGSVVVSQSTVFIASIFLNLSDVASYGITMQVITVLVTLSKLYMDTYMPKISEHRVEGNLSSIKNIYIKGLLYFVFVAFFSSICLLICGNLFLNTLESKTLLLPTSMLFCLLLFSFLDANQVIASNVIVSGNRVPFLKSTLITAFCSIVAIVVLLKYTSCGLWALILGPGCIQLLYQDWKWPLIVFRELKHS
ncbi:MAG: O-unit flippase-like protein [Bacteroidales bacterium]